MSAAMMFLIVFCVAWLGVAGTTIAYPMRPRRMRRDISLLARAGLLIWFTGVIAAIFADVRHWPAREIGRMHAVGTTCKLTGFALLIAGLALQAFKARLRRSARAGSRTRTGVMPPPDAQLSTACHPFRPGQPTTFALAASATPPSTGSHTDSPDLKPC